MKIELLYQPIHDIEAKMLRKKITLPAGSTIEDVLPLVHAKGLAVWRDDPPKAIKRFNYYYKKYPLVYRIPGLKGRVVSDLMTEGELKPNGKYMILSKNYRKTIELLRKL